MNKKITILGIGNILLSDEGVGIRIIERLQDLYEFPENVSIIDGGVLGFGLLGIICEADILIAIDAIKNNQAPGTVYIINHDEIFTRMRAKNSIHQIDFLETLSACKLLDKLPIIKIFGIEPKDIYTLSLDLSDIVSSKIREIIDLVLLELKNLNIFYKAK